MKISIIWGKLHCLPAWWQEVCLFSPIRLYHHAALYCCCCETTIQLHGRKCHMEASRKANCVVVVPLLPTAADAFDVTKKTVNTVEKSPKKFGPPDAPAKKFHTGKDAGLRRPLLNRTSKLIEWNKIKNVFIWLVVNGLYSEVVVCGVREKWNHSSCLLYIFHFDLFIYIRCRL